MPHVQFACMQEGLPLSSLAPDGHYYRAFSERHTLLKRQVGAHMHAADVVLAVSYRSLHAKLSNSVAVIEGITWHCCCNLL